VSRVITALSIKLVGKSVITALRYWMRYIKQWYISLKQLSSQCTEKNSLKALKIKETRGSGHHQNSKI